MNRWIRTLAVSVTALITLTGSARAESAGAETPGVVCNVKVVSDKVHDVSSVEAWKTSFINEGMTDQEKALAIWRSVITFQYQDGPPSEMLHHEQIVYDPIKMFNVYGYAMCSPHSAHFTGLARAIGFQARGWGISHHSVPEIYYDGAWHLFDTSLMTYFLKEDGTVAGVEELIAAVNGWYAQHPEFTNISNEERDKKLRAFQRTDDRQGWKLHGPKLIASSPTYDHRGWWPAGTHGWYATMQEYDGTAGEPGTKAFIHEYGASMGYRVNIQLRPGERLTRNWGHNGLHVNMDRSKNNPDAMEDKSGFVKNNQAFCDKLDPTHPNLTNGRIGNGTHEYDVPLASADFKRGALAAENLATTAEDGAAPALHLADAAKPGVLVIRMPSSYVYLSGTALLDAAVGNGGEIRIDISDNNGLDWTPLRTIIASGPAELDLKDEVYRRYDYRLRFTLKGQGTGLNKLKIVHDIQHSQRPLPALAQGSNRLTFYAGPQESTITVEANNKPDHQGKQVTYADLHATRDGLDENLKVTGRQGSLTVPIETPGDMTRLRFGGYYRTWGDEDRWDFEVSYDGGKTFKKAGEGPPQKFGRTAYVTVGDIPTGTRQALVRYVGTAKDGNVLGSFRIDADYTDANFGFRPVKVTYTWEEDGQEKIHEHVARAVEDVYTIECAQKPTMKSIVLELAD